MPYPIRVGVQCRPQHTDYARCATPGCAARRRASTCSSTGTTSTRCTATPDGPHFECWTMLAAMGRADRAPRSAPGHVQHVPQPRPARRHGPHRRPHQRRTVDPRHRRGLVRARLRRVRLRVRHGAGPARATGEALPLIRAAGRAQPGAARTVPMMIGGGGEKVTLRLVAEHADDLARLRRAETRAKNARPRRVVRASSAATRARSSARSASRPPTPTASTTS